MTTIDDARRELDAATEAFALADSAYRTARERLRVAKLTLRELTRPSRKPVTCTRCNGHGLDLVTVAPCFCPAGVRLVEGQGLNS